MLRSFRLKVGLIGAGLAGGVLLAFGLYYSAVIWRIGCERLDHELLALADGQVRLPKPPQHWARFDESLRNLYGAESDKQFVVRVMDADGRVCYQSAQWPAAIDVVILPPTFCGEAPAPGAQTRRPASTGGSLRGNRSPRGPSFGMQLISGALARHAAAVGLLGYGVVWMPEFPLPPQMRVGSPEYSTVTADDAAWRFVSVANDEIALTVGMNLSPFHREARRLRAAFVVAALVALALLSAAGWFVAQTALRPVRLIARTAEMITASRLDQRIPVTRADAEFQRLIKVINEMLDRLERGYRQAVRFSADAAHELKTPLMLLQGELEQALQKAPDRSSEQRTYGALLEEAHRLKEIVRKLLLLAQADSGRICLTSQRLRLAGLVTDACDDLRVIAPTLTLETDLDSQVVVTGDAGLLNQALLNLLDNALKFNDERNLIVMTLRAAPPQAVLTIVNTGPGIAANDHAHLFERFYRADKARGRRVDGAGLGLSLAHEIIRAHGGDLVLTRSDPQFTIFTLTMPLT